MLKDTININEYTEPKTTLQNFRKLCDRSDLADADGLYRQVEHALNEFADRGSQLVAVGSEFSIVRTLKGDDFEIVLDASFGSKPSLIDKVRKLVGF
jgi:hypothetical protein